MALRMAADCSYLRLSTAFVMVRAPYCLADSSGLLVLSLVNGFPDGLRADFLSGLPCIAHTSMCQQLLRRFAPRIAPPMAVDCSFFRSSTGFTVCVPFCSADDCALLILPLVKGFHHGLRAVLLCGWQWIAHSSACQRLSL